MSLQFNSNKDWKINASKIHGFGNTFTIDCSAIDLSGVVTINNNKVDKISVNLENSIQYYLPMTDAIANSGTKTLGDLILAQDLAKAPIISDQTGIDLFTNWIKSSSGLTGKNWRSIAWSPKLSLFVACGKDAYTMYSSDGITWSTPATVGTEHWNSVTWSVEKEKFLIIGNNGDFAYSTNGTSWTTGDTGGSSGNHWQHVIYVPELAEYIAVGLNGFITNNEALTTGWETPTDTGTHHWRSVAWSPELNLLVSVGYDQTTPNLDRQMWSDNGFATRTITTMNMSTASGGAGGQNGARWNSVAWSPELGIFAGVGQNAWYFWSTDGKTWSTPAQTTHISPANGGVDDWKTVIWISELSKFLATGMSGWLMYSSDGKTWTTYDSGNELWYFPVWSQELGKLVVVGEDSIGGDQITMYTSPQYVLPTTKNIFQGLNTTSLQVDNLNVNGNTISASSGAVNITPVAGSAIVLDGTISIDGGLVTGATSITSTAFVGNVTGNVSGTATTVTVTNSTASTAFPIVFNDESSSLLDHTGSFTYTPSSGLLQSYSATHSLITGQLTGNVTGNVSGSSGSCTGNAATVTVTNSTADTAFPIVFNNEANGLFDDTGTFTYNPSSGNVGIGTAAPDEKLEVNGASHFGNRIDIYVGGGSMCGQLGSQGDLGGLTGLAQTDFGIKTTLGGFGIATSGSASTRLYIKSDGFVGINTTSPTTLFEISKAQSDTIDATNAFLALKGSGGDGILMGQTSSSPYGAWIQAGNVPNPSGIPYPLCLNPHGGKVGVETTSPSFGLDCDVDYLRIGGLSSNVNYVGTMISAGNSDTNPYLFIGSGPSPYNQTPANATYGFGWFYRSTDGHLRLSRKNNSTSFSEILTCSRSTGVVSFVSTISNGSDDRIKHNEYDISNGLSIIRQLQPQRYQKTQEMYAADYMGDISGDYTEEAGLIAQDILQIPDLSFCVHGGDRIGPSGEIIEESYSLSYNNILVYGLAAIKELDAKNTTLEAELSATKTELATVKTALNTLLLAQGLPTI